jgi:hypothetical protein
LEFTSQTFQPFDDLNDPEWMKYMTGVAFQTAVINQTFGIFWLFAAQRIGSQSQR